MSKKLLKIGIVGPRPYSIGGHEHSHPLRVEIRDRITSLFKNLKEDYELMGVTGLGLGVEQDFAHACIESNIDYMCFLPFPEQENHWENLPESITKTYQALLDTAFKVITIDEGDYSPKKIMNKKMRIIDESNAVVWIKNYLCDLSNKILLKDFDPGKIYSIEIGNE